MTSFQLFKEGKAFYFMDPDLPTTMLCYSSKTKFITTLKLEQQVFKVEKITRFGFHGFSLINPNAKLHYTKFTEINFL